MYLIILVLQWVLKLLRLNDFVFDQLESDFDVSVVLIITSSKFQIEKKILKPILTRKLEVISLLAR